MKSLIRIEPKILPKVIHPFETKLGAGRLYLRWTTRKSQVQFLKSQPRLIRGESACNPRSNCLDAAAGLRMRQHVRNGSAGRFSVPSLLGWLAEFECLGWANAFRRRGAVARQMLRLRVRVGSKQEGSPRNKQRRSFAFRTANESY